MFRKLTGFLLLNCLCLGWSLANDITADIVVKDQFKEQRLDGSSVWILEDKEGIYGLEEVISWYQAGEKGVNRNYFAFGLRESAYWLGFTVRNESGRERELLLELINSYLNDFHFHRLSEGGILKSDTNPID